MKHTIDKLATMMVNEEFFPPDVWQGVVRTKERNSLLNQNWPIELKLDQNAATNIYNCYPYLFLSAFPALSPSTISDFSLATHLFANSLFCADRVMDQNLSTYERTQTLSLIMAMQKETYTLLQSLFPPESPFWTYFHAYLSHYMRSCLLEKQLAQGDLLWREYNESAAYDVAAGKAGVSRAVIAGLATLSGDTKTLEVFNESISLYNFAFQMFDDLTDWKLDYLAQSPSLLLCQWLRERPVAPVEEDLETLTRDLYYDGHASRVLHLAVNALDRASLITTAWPDLPWRSILSRLHERCNSLLYDIEKTLKESRHHAEQIVDLGLHLPAARTSCEYLAQEALQFLIYQWKRGFGEAYHCMYFDRAQGFTGKSEFHYGDIFQRAVIADIIWEAGQTFQQDVDNLLQVECDYLIDKRNRDGIRGWTYFPDLPELPPDTDDLAQMLQLFLHTEREEAIALYCEFPLNILLRDNCHADGSFETWIIPHELRTPKQERQWHYVHIAWGTGVDVDVMANMLYALALYDPIRFAREIREGTAYIESQQQPDGSWKSTWYHGPYYGIFACLRLLAQTSPHSPTLERARAFLLQSQLADGGWGVQSTGDALSTALALLGWSELARVSDIREAIPEIRRASVFLRTCFEENEQAWPACDWIRMELGRASGQIQQILSYGSRTMTTAFVLKATASWCRLQEQLGVTL